MLPLAASRPAAAIVVPEKRWTPEFEVSKPANTLHSDRRGSRDGVQLIGTVGVDVGPFAGGTRRIHPPRSDR
jgi:hypothetical protein